MREARGAAPCIDVKPLDPVGVEVLGYDPTGLFTAGIADQLREAFAEHGLLVFRDLDLDVEQQLALARIFGEPVVREKNIAPDLARRTQHVSNTLDDGVFGTGALDFHMDQLFWDPPLKALMLYGIDVPGSGGDTKFVDTHRVYRNLPEALRARIDALHCRHAYTFAGDLAADWNVKDAETQDMAATHPIVWRDPARDRVGLWVNKLTTVGVMELPGEDGRALIAEIRGHLYDETVTYSHAWRAGDLVLWDNRIFQHARMPFDETRPRTLRRTTLL